MTSLPLFMLLLGAYFWMRSHQRSAVQSPRPPPFTIEVDSEGVTLRRDTSLKAWLRWEDIGAVRSFKVDCYGYDLIWFAVDSRAEGAGFCVNEEHPQFEELAGAFAARLRGFDLRWFQKVAFPPFETCETLVYKAAEA